jgi:hypothetical protein
VTTLADKLRAALDETEQLAQRTLNGPFRGMRAGVYTDHHETPPVQGAIVRVSIQPMLGEGPFSPIYLAYDPTVVLRMVAAHRKILDLHTPMQWAFKWIGPSDDPANRVPDMRCSACWTDYDPDGKYDRECHHDPHEWPCDTVKALAEGYGVEV